MNGKLVATDIEVIQLFIDSFNSSVHVYSVSVLSNNLLVEAPEFLLCSFEFQDLKHYIAVLISTLSCVTWSKVSGRLVLTVSGTTMARTLPKMETREKM